VLAVIVGLGHNAGNGRQLQLSLFSFPLLDSLMGCNILCNMQQATWLNRLSDICSTRMQLQMSYCLEHSIIANFVKEVCLLSELPPMNVSNTMSGSMWTCMSSGMTIHLGRTSLTAAFQALLTVQHRIISTKSSRLLTILSNGGAKPPC